MPRVRKGAARAKKHRKILRFTRGQIGAASRRYRVAREAILRAGQHALIGRKLRKRDFRRLWITRISAACHQRDINYSRFIHGLITHGIAVNRKMLADLAVSDPGAFDQLVAAAMAEAPAKPAADKPAKPAADKPAKPAADKPAKPAEKPKSEVVEEPKADKPAKPAADKPKTEPVKEAKAEAADKPAPKKKAATKKKTTKKAAAKKPAAKKTKADEKK